MFKYGYGNELTIADAMQAIHSNQFVLPAIQREYTWSTEQIEKLFDSIMQSYPLNTFMSWQISEEELKTSILFYDFLSDYKQGSQTTNSRAPKQVNSPDFYAIIDGQQRLNSLYLGLFGSYSTRKKYKRGNKESDFEKKVLYFNLDDASKDILDQQMKYEFKFLSKVEKEKTSGTWFEISKALSLSGSKLYKYVEDELGVGEDSSKIQKVELLMERLTKDKLLNFYNETEQNLDKVLDIFIRTNAGGTRLSPSDLVMSMISSQWDNARSMMKQLVIDVESLGGFVINQDFILKANLVLYSESKINPSLSNLKPKILEQIRTNWEQFTKSTIATFKMFYRMGFSEITFTAKNAALPIIYYVHKHGIENKIDQPEFYHGDEAKKIRRWLNMSFVNNVFGGSPDSIILAIRKLINQYDYFPFDEIIERFKSNPNRHYNFNIDTIEELLETSYGGNRKADFLLFLIQDYFDFFNQSYNVDHIHPKSYFLNLEKTDKIAFESYQGKWNKLPNLQLLNSRSNQSKNAKSLEEWITDSDFRDKNDLLLDENVSLHINNFDEFYEHRKSKMRDRLISVLLNDK